MYVAICGINYSFLKPYFWTIDSNTHGRTSGYNTRDRQTCAVVAFSRIVPNSTTTPLGNDEERN